MCVGNRERSADARLLKVSCIKCCALVDICNGEKAENTDEVLMSTDQIDLSLEVGRYLSCCTEAAGRLSGRGEVRVDVSVQSYRVRIVSYIHLALRQRGRFYTVKACLCVFFFTCMV